MRDEGASMLEQIRIQIRISVSRAACVAVLKESSLSNVWLVQPASQPVQLLSSAQTQSSPTLHVWHSGPLRKDTNSMFSLSIVDLLFNQLSAQWIAKAVVGFGLVSCVQMISACMLPMENKFIFLSPTHNRQKALRKKT